MDKRLINSINSQIGKLTAKIEKWQAEIIELENRRDKFQEMLALVTPQPDSPKPAEPTQQATEPEPSKSEVPAFLRKG